MVRAKEGQTGMKKIGLVHLDGKLPNLALMQIAAYHKALGRERVETLKSWEVDPFVMAYDKSDYYQNAFQRWVNHRAIFHSVPFEEYKPAYTKRKSMTG